MEKEGDPVILRFLAYNQVLRVGLSPLLACRLGGSKVQKQTWTVSYETRTYGHFSNALAQHKCTFPAHGICIHSHAMEKNEQSSTSGKILLATPESFEH